MWSCSAIRSPGSAGSNSSVGRGVLGPRRAGPARVCRNAHTQLGPLTLVQHRE
jgi:hypothetical protein